MIPRVWGLVGWGIWEGGIRTGLEVITGCSSLSREEGSESAMTAGVRCYGHFHWTQGVLSLEILILLVCVTSVPVICSTAQQAVRFGTELGVRRFSFYPPSGGLQVCRLVCLLLLGMGLGLIGF